MGAKNIGGGGRNGASERVGIKDPAAKVVALGGADARKRPVQGPDARMDRPPFLGSTALRLKQICRFDEQTLELHSPERGWDLEAGLQRSIGNLLDLLGWDMAAEFLVETEQTRGFRLEEVVTVDPALVIGTPAVVLIRFTIPRNASVMFKRIEIAPLNCTAEEFGETFISETSEGEIERPERAEGIIGVTPEPGRFVLPQSVIRQDEGGLVLFLLNNDPFAEARFEVDLYGWVIER